MDLVILTPIAIEYAAFQPYLEHRKMLTKAGAVYAAGQFAGQQQCYSLAIRQTGPKNNQIALAAEKAIQAFQPEILILAGIAGGVKDVCIGDIAVATKAYGYESGKETAAGFLVRPEVIAFDAELLELARAFAHNQKDKSARIYFGPIASGDKVIATTQSDVYRLLKQNYNDTIALEMESIGFARAVQGHKRVRAMNIRGISDMLDHKSDTDRQGSQTLATERVAAFTFAFLKQLDFKSLKNNPMDEKTLLQRILELIFPLLRLDSVHTIGSEFKTATDNSILELWKKVRPYFIEEIENAGGQLDQAEVQQELRGAIKSSLRKSLRKKPAFQKELTALVKAVELGQEKSDSVKISNSKNVIQGSQISVGGNFHVGDNQ